MFPGWLPYSQNLWYTGFDCVSLIFNALALYQGKSAVGLASTASGQTDLLSKNCVNRVVMTFLVLSQLLLVTTGCKPPPPISATPKPGSTSIPTRAPTTAPSTPQPSTGARQPLTLTMWLPLELANSAVTPNGYLFEVNKSYDNLHPDTSLVQMPKALSGPGGTVNLLLTTKAAAPANLPDIALIDAAELVLLAQSGIAQPVDDYLQDAYWDGFYPYIKPAIRYKERYVAIPFMTDLILMIYNESMVETAPTTWASLTTLTTRYIFPTASGDGTSADTFVLQYLSLGGTLQGADGRPMLDAAIAEQVLRSYAIFLETGVFPENIRELATYDECWELYFNGEAAITHAPYSLYNRNRALMTRTRYAAVPTISEEVTTLAHGYAWVVTAVEPEKQRLAVDYLLAAMQPDLLAGWASEQHLLPVRKDGLEITVRDSSYRQFLNTLLDSAYPYPTIRNYARIQDVIGQAIEDVLSGMQTPERAAQTAAIEISRLR